MIPNAEKVRVSPPEVNGSDGTGGKRFLDGDFLLSADVPVHLPVMRTHTYRTAASLCALAAHGDSHAVRGFGWWPYVLALGLLGGLVFPGTVRTRGKGRRRGGRHGRE